LQRKIDAENFSAALQTRANFSSRAAIDSYGNLFISKINIASRHDWFRYFPRCWSSLPSSSSPFLLCARQALIPSAENREWGEIAFGVSFSRIILHGGSQA